MEISTEFAGIDLGDKRRDDRARSLLDTLAAQPQASINSSCDGWDETKAGYR